jgi:nitrite reductase/ring-hydroxylating ferredoxin subunit
MEQPLVSAAVYRRDVHASIERVWENVLDWEHLPWLHRAAFRSIECEDAGAWGWRARVGFEPQGDSRIELLVERDASRYVVRTLEGAGRGSEIWTRLDPRGHQLTGVEVEFRVPGLDRVAARAVGDAYTRLYQQLWDEDEVMMRRRAAALARREVASKGTPEETSLGSLELLRERLPLAVEAGGRSWRVVEVDGSLRAHSVVCPHMLGPLDEAEIVDGCVRCPWHGYVFDLDTTWSGKTSGSGRNDGNRAEAKTSGSGRKGGNRAEAKDSDSGRKDGNRAEARFPIT